MAAAPERPASPVARWWCAFPTNARVLVATEPAWSVLGAYWGLYMPLYLTALGAAPGLIGWIASWSQACNAVCSLLGGVVGQRVSRIRAVVVIDFCTWLMPLAAWFLFPTLWVAVVAQLVTVMSMLVVPAWNALFLEDARPEQRPQLMNLFQLAVSGPAVCLPLLSRLIRTRGLVAVTRGVFALSLVTVGAAWAIRWALVRDSQFATDLIAEQTALGRRGVVDGYRRVLAALVRPGPLAVFALTFCLNARNILWTTYLPLLLVGRHGLHLSRASIVVLPAAGSVAMVSAGLIALRHLRHDRPVGAMAAAQAGAFAAAAWISLAPPGAWWQALGAWVIGAAAAAVAFPAQSGMWYNLFPRRDFTSLQAVAGTLSTVAVVPVGVIAGTLFAASPRLPFACNAALQGLGMVIAGWMWLRPPAVAADDALDVPAQR